MSTFGRVLVGLAVATVAFSANANLATSGSVYLKADPGSWVGGGIGANEVVWKHGIDGIFSAATNFSQGISVTYQSADFWSFDFAAPSYNPISNTNTGQPLEVKFYSDATRWPFNSPTKPGLSISGAGRGNNQLSGWFNVLQVEYGAGGDIASYAADFRQYDESTTLTGPSLYGSIRINSAIPLNLSAVPEPASMATMLVGLLAVFGLARLVNNKGAGAA